MASAIESIRCHKLGDLDGDRGILRCPGVGVWTGGISPEIDVLGPFMADISEIQSRLLFKKADKTDIKGHNKLLAPHGTGQRGD
tara:strand:+ start:9183 stop:9434 length:252 start_codon:yes stop_codon:yes gene_type:complete